jgi:predicted nuclease with RNAse H fold
MSGEPKSAYEIAMERLRRKDVEEGVAEREVSEEQKEAIAEARRVYTAKAAEAEILHKSAMMTIFDPEERMKLEQQHRRDLERLQTDLDRKLARIRG